MSIKITDIYFASATQKSHDEFWKDSHLAKFLRKAKVSDQAYIAYNNKIGLPDVYNHAILHCEQDYVVCVHDDVIVEDLFWLEKLEQGFREFEILGLAGASAMQIKSPALWHLMSPKENWCGFVNHFTPDNHSFATNFGLSPKRCVVMDGLFLALNKNAIIDKGVLFDPQFHFHHYDIDFCIQANKAGLKMSTIPLHVTHQSGGLNSTSDKVWKNSENLFLTKYS
jgi:GT2 family glycosyltransferase